MARLLLADPLGSRERWEDDLEQSNFQDERPVLLRYDRSLLRIYVCLTETKVW
jgi:hypothetical protein